MSRRVLPLFLMPVLLAAAPAQQAPSAAWRTIRTAHYRIHYPPLLADWAQDVAARVEDIHAAVKELVGYESPRPVQVLLRDPVQEANGMAMPLLDFPFVELWATAPEGEQFSDALSSWTEELVAHEFTHIQHLTRPQNRPNLFDRLLDLPVSPLVLGAPRWVHEGYATLAEGRLTGSGRPHSALRAATLRQWALQGKLPNYEALSEVEGFRGGSMAYLVGSAYLEWLERQRPSQPDLLKRLWKQVVSRKRRSFDESFQATLGFSPQDGYGRFCAELSHDALEWEGRVRAEGLREGELWWRGDAWIPSLSVSPDGKRLLAEVRAPKQPGLRVWTLKPEVKEDAKTLREKARDAKDPSEVEDVPPEFPAPKAEAFLPRLDFRMPDRPRWVDDQTVFFQLKVADGEGTLRRHAALWRLKGGVEVDPVMAPKAHWTILEPVLRAGRWSLEWQGRAVVLPGQAFGRAVLDTQGGQLYAACLLDGTPNLVRLPVVAEGFGAAVRLTRTAAAAWNPAPTPDGKALYFTRLDARGLQIRKLDLTEAPLSVPAAGLPEPRILSTATVQPPAIEADPLPAPGLAPASEPYSAIQNLWNRQAAGLSISPSGKSLQVGMGGEDILGRLAWQALVSSGERGGPSGATAGFSYSGWAWRPSLNLFLAQERPSNQALEPRPGLDRQRLGGELALAFEDKSDHPFWISPVLGWEHDKSQEGGITSERALAGLHAIAGGKWGRGSLGLDLRIEIQGYVGRDTSEAQSGRSWRGSRSQVSLAFLKDALPLTLKAEAGRLGGEAGEVFRLGGLRNSLVAESLDWNRLEQPALPAFHALGDRFQRWRAEAGGPIRGYVEGTVLWSAGQPRGAYQRVAGVEAVMAKDSAVFPRILGIGPRRLELIMGVHRILDGPLRDHGAFTLGLIVRP